MDDLRSRLANRVQRTTDGHNAYLEAVEGAFGSNIDYAQLVKLYGLAEEPERRYSPPSASGRSRPASAARRTRQRSARPTTSART